MSVEDALLWSIGYVRLWHRSDVYVIQYNWSERQWHYTILFRMTSVGDLTVKSADSLTSAVLTCAHCWLTFRQSHSIRSSPIRHEILPVCAFCFTSSLWETNAQRREQILLHFGRDAGDLERVYPPLGLYTVTDDVLKYSSLWCYGNKEALSQRTLTSPTYSHYVAKLQLCK